MRRRTLVLLLPLLLPLVVACARGTEPVPSPVAWEPPAYTGLNLATLGPYAATFEVQFKGSYDWVYRLETRSDGSAVEHRLHLEGVDASRNPGDVRAVIQEGTIRMRGPGTDEACVQVPADVDLGLAFLTPDDLVDPEGVRGPLQPLGVETAADLAATRYTVQQTSLGDWRDVRLDLWLDGESGAVLRYDLRATGPDPLFDAGEGQVEGQFVVADVGSQEIEPVAGCEIDVPLPSDAARVTKLPGLIAFEGARTPAEMAAFFRAALPEAGWEPVNGPEGDSATIVLSYRHGGQTLEINVEKRDEGARVELLLNEE